MTKFCIIICDLCGKSCLLFVTWPDRINVTMQTLFTARAAQRAQVTDILSFMFTIISLSFKHRTSLEDKTNLVAKAFVSSKKLYFPDDLLNSLNP